MIGVFEWGGDDWHGITTYQSENEVEALIILKEVRQGTRVYVRP